MIRSGMLYAAATLATTLVTVVAPASTAAVRDEARTTVRDLAVAEGWDGAEWRCLDELVWRESRWSPTAKNPRSSARGLFQMLRQEPGLPVEHQARAGFDYIAARYSTPCRALAFHRRKGWY